MPVKFRNSIRDVTDVLGESGIEVPELELIFENGNSLALTEAPKRTAKNFKASKPILRGKENNDPELNKTLNPGGRMVGAYQIDGNHSTNMPDFRDSLRIPGSMHNVAITYIDKQHRTETIHLSPFIRVRIIPVDSTKILEAMASAKARGMFQNYLSWRAGLSPFFKGFIMNLAEIKKQVKRDTSKDLTERILGSLLSKSGFTRPMLLGEITEFKNYNVVISSDDADRLIREYFLS